MKKTVALLLLVCLLLAAYLYLEKPQPRFFSEPIFEKANKITIIQSDGAIKLEKKSHWQVIEPVGANVDQGFVSSLSQLLQDLNPETTIEQVDPRQGIYGLIPPSLVFIIEGEFGKEVFSFGKYADFAAARYLQREGDSKIYLIKDDLFKLLNLNLNSIRTKNPLNFDLNSLQSIAVIRGNLSSFVVKKNSNNWKLESIESSFDVDQKTFNLALQKLSKLEVINFYEDTNLEFYGLANPALTLRLLLNNGKDQDSKVYDLIFGKGSGANPFYYMKELGSLSIFQIQRAAYADWLKEQDFFRTRKVFDKVQTLDGQALSVQQINALNEIYALGVMNTVAFVPGEQKVILEFNEKTLEIGQSIPSAGSDKEQPPSFVKINSEKQEYVLILGAKDIEFLKSLSSNVN